MIRTLERLFGLEHAPAEQAQTGQCRTNQQPITGRADRDRAIAEGAAAGTAGQVGRHGCCCRHGYAAGIADDAGSGVRIVQTAISLGDAQAIVTCCQTRTIGRRCTVAVDTRRRGNDLAAGRVEGVPATRRVALAAGLLLLSKQGELV